MWIVQIQPIMFESVCYSVTKNITLICWLPGNRVSSLWPNIRLFPLVSPVGVWAGDFPAGQMWYDVFQLPGNRASAFAVLLSDLYVDTIIIWYRTNFVAVWNKTMSTCFGLCLCTYFKLYFLWSSTAIMIHCFHFVYEGLSASNCLCMYVYDVNCSALNCIYRCAYATWLLINVYRVVVDDVVDC
jgi:hypothetical protein